jgi:polygalacturonase
MVSYQGYTSLTNVEFYKMGQRNNQHAALRFSDSNLPSTSTAFSSVEGCAIHESAGWGLKVINSSNITLKNIDVFDLE